MVYSDLENLKDELLEKIQDEDFLNGFTDELDADQILWANGPSFTIVPLEFEMSGVKPAKALFKEPQNKKNVTKNYLLNGRVIKIEVFNSNAVLHEVEFFRFSDYKTYSLRKNKYEEIVWLKAAEYAEREVVRACRVDMDMEYWAYRYSWSANRVGEIASFASNGVAGVVINAEYDKGGSIVRLFFIAEGREVNVYP